MALPFGQNLAVKLAFWLSPNANEDYALWWDNRYAAGGDSGPGSRGHLANYKAQFVNRFVLENGVRSIVELGCGDGGQLKLAEYPQYIGLDISEAAVRLCQSTFAADPKKQFALYDPRGFEPESIRADLALSLDVIYHIMREEDFQLYVRHLFDAAHRWVIIYSTNRPIVTDLTTEKHRRISAWIRRYCPAWTLVHEEPNPFPYQDNPDTGTRAQFFVYERMHAGD